MPDVSVILEPDHSSDFNLTSQLCHLHTVEVGNELLTRNIPLKETSNSTVNKTTEGQTSTTQESISLKGKVCSSSKLNFMQIRIHSIPVSITIAERKYHLPRFVYFITLIISIPLILVIFGLIGAVFVLNYHFNSCTDIPTNQPTKFGRFLLTIVSVTIRNI